MLPKWQQVINFEQTAASLSSIVAGVRTPGIGQSPYLNFLRLIKAIQYERMLNYTEFQPLMLI